MTDADFLRALETCVLPESEFRHAAHLRAAYLYLQQADFVGALKRIRRAIRNYATTWENRTGTTKRSRWRTLR
jgi:hypothetical protein